jgi:hypothetical protein
MLAWETKVGVERFVCNLFCGKASEKADECPTEGTMLVGMYVSCVHVSQSECCGLLISVERTRINHKTTRALYEILREPLSN